MRLLVKVTSAISGYRPGDEVEVEEDDPLWRRHLASETAVVIERLGEPLAVSLPEPEPEPAEPTAEPEPDLGEEPLEGYTIAELFTVARHEGLTLSAATRKADLIEAIRERRRRGFDEGEGEGEA